MFATRLSCALVALQAVTGFAQQPAAEPAKPPAKLERVDVTGKQLSDTDERRDSTAAKIIVGRDEIERFGDSNLSEVFKRLPGVTVQGTSRRNREIRLRGLGSGYTQILLDGERVPARFSLDSLSPEQIERIEILRAPTAETGARAIAGTINIITRDGVRKRINDVRVSTEFENGQVQPSVTWTKNDAAGALNYNVSLTAAHDPRASESVTSTTDQRISNGATTLAQYEASLTRDRRQNLSLSTRLRWREEDGDTVTVSPVFTHTETHTHRESRLDQTVGTAPPLYRQSATDGDSRSTNARVSGQWRGQITEESRLELRGALRQSRGNSASLRNEFNADGARIRVLNERATTRERTASAGAKLSRPLGDAHNVVGGIEAEAARRNEARTTLQDGAPILADFGDDVAASSTRYAAYVQDEWTISPQWSANGGLRWEGISTLGDDGSDKTRKNRSSVWTPLAHTVWKPDPASRDQVRLSLTRSYRSPALRDLIARPSISTRFPVPGANSPTSPDRAGNPDLRPELARGIDVAFEHYPDGGGLLSANLFHRDIRNLIRNTSRLEKVTWANVPRWVSRARNVGDANTQGVELEAKFRLNQLMANAAPVDLRANVSLFRSRVVEVPGPDNRLDQQPRATANFGADYRLRSVPLSLGGNINWNPAYNTRVSDIQTAFQGRKTIVDAYALWTFNPSVQLRVSASNLAPLDNLTSTSIEADDIRESARNTARSFVNWQMRLEMKL